MSDTNGRTATSNKVGGKHAFEQSDSRPVPLAVNADGIPADLEKLHQWVLWRYERRDGRWTKVPCQPNGRNADSTTPRTWTTFVEALRAYRSGGFDGIGFVLAGEHIGIDLDDVRSPDTGEIEPWALQIIQTVSSYTEVSPSKTGAKIIAVGNLALQGNRFPGVELYDRGRFFTVTGEVIDDCCTVESRQDQVNRVHQQLIDLKKQRDAAKRRPRPPSATPAVTGSLLTDEELLAKALNMPSGEKLRRLLDGDHLTFGSASEADLSLCTHLAAFTDDPEQIRRIVQASGANRSKWDRDDYADRTIRKAIEGRAWRYDPNYRRGHGDRPAKRPTTSGTAGQPPEKPAQAAQPSPPPEQYPSVDIGDVRLVLTSQKSTESKATAHVRVLYQGMPKDLFTVTSAADSREKTARYLCANYPDLNRKEVGMALSQIVLWAQDRASRSDVRAGETMRDIVKRFLDEELAPRCLTADGAIFCDRRGELRRADIIACTSNELLKAVEAAANAPPARAALLKAVEAELKVYYADQLSSLPRASEAELTPDSIRGKKFIAALTRVLTTQTWVQGQQRHQRASIAQLAAAAFHLARDTSIGWTPVSPGIYCWWRVRFLPDGQQENYLGIDWKITHHIENRLSLPEVEDQSSLVRILKALQLADPEPPFSAKTDGGDKRLSVLARPFTDPLVDGVGPIRDE
jgi:hypothetical protein